MVTSELGACEWFVWDLRRSNLIDRGRLDQVVGEFLQKNPRAEPPALAEFLTQQGILTDFQAERLLQGKTQGFVLGPFTLMDALGAGSMGTVYKAQSKTDNNWYAVKVLPRRSMWNVRIARRKVRLFEQARHPVVVPFVDVGTSGGMHYLAWPLVEGETLDKKIERDGKLSPGTASHIALQAAEGLEVCQQQGLIHGLLKPSNIMLGTSEQVYLLDFGIGCLLAETEGESLVDTMSTANAVTSGLDCASPESIMDPNNLTPAGDQYSLGCTLYYMLTGQYPFPDGNAAEKMMAHQFKEPTPISEFNPDVTAGLIEVIQRLMKKAPDQRYHATSEVIDALRPFASKGSGLLPRPTVASRGSAPGFTLKPAAAGGSKSSAPGMAPKPAAGPGSKPGFGERPSHQGLPARPAAPATPAAPAAAAQRPSGQRPSGPRPVTTAPSSPTPRPQALGNLPTRDAIRGPARPQTMMATPPAPPPQAEYDQAEYEPQDEQQSERVIPGDYTAEAQRASWDERLGPLGVALSAGVACAVVYFLAVLFRVF